MSREDCDLFEPIYNSLTIKFENFLILNSFSIETDEFRITSVKTPAFSEWCADNNCKDCESSFSVKEIKIETKNGSKNAFYIFMLFYEFINLAIGYFPPIAESKGDINGIEQRVDLKLSAKYTSNTEHIDNNNRLLYIDQIDKAFVTQAFIKWQDMRKGIKKCGSLYYDAFLICQSDGYKYRDMQLVTLLQSIEGYSRRNEINDDKKEFGDRLGDFICSNFCFEAYIFASEKSIKSDNSNRLFLNIKTLRERCVNERNRLSHMNFYGNKAFLNECYSIVVYYKLILQFRLHLINDIGLINSVDADNLKSNISNTEDWYKGEGIYHKADTK